MTADPRRRPTPTCATVVPLTWLAFGGGPAADGDEFLTWNAARAEAIGRATYQKGRVGGFSDMRMLDTEGSYNYELAALWLTSEVVRAGAR
jgi:hypothetical protein